MDVKIYNSAQESGKTCQNRGQKYKTGDFDGNVICFAFDCKCTT